MSLNLEYRPTQFDEVFGNDELVTSLENMLKRDKPRSSYFFTGMPGSGKTTMAVVLKNELNVSDMAYYEYNSANTRGIDTIRNIIAEASSLPIMGKKKLYLLDECSQITGIAMEALLKFLEAPPKHVFIVLCTSEPSKINGNTLSAVKRRCFCAELKKLTPPEIVEYIGAICDAEKKKVDKKTTMQIAKLSDGSIGHALSLLDTYFTSNRIDLSQSAYVSEATLKPIINTLMDINSSGPARWNRARKFLDKFEGDAEEARRAIAGYLNRVIMNKDLAKGKPYNDMAIYFTDSFAAAGKLGLTLACRAAIESQDVPF